ncbi:hypothetical protein [Streptomyces sp. NPDC059639]|uniref:hypothetical protein n=1 Tax=Streptomyces sp. NPDC059639 TaxID=3346891 RepID=UPI0036B4E619
MPSPAKNKQGAAEPKRAPELEKSGRVEAHESEQHLAVHTLNATLPIPYFTPGDLANNTRAVTGWLPSPPRSEDVIYYGGLGALAVAGALEWPVALAVAGATWVLRSRRGDRAESTLETEAVSGSRRSGLS